MNWNDKLSTHFTYGELIWSATAARHGIDNTPPEKYTPKLKILCKKILEPVRSHYGIPFRPNSGYRCNTLNTLIKGSTTSQHMKAEAVDFELAGISNYDLAVWIQDNLEYDQLILECYTPGCPGSGWVHVSYSTNNRKQVLTFSNNKYTTGLHE